MKATQGFSPIHLTIESRDEAVVLLALMDSISTCDVVHVLRDSPMYNGRSVRVVDSINRGYKELSDIVGDVDYGSLDIMLVED